MTHSIPQDKESLIRIFSRAKDLLKELHEKDPAQKGDFPYYSNPVPNFENKGSFPLDFQIFMEIIGESNPFELHYIELPTEGSQAMGLYDPEKLNPPYDDKVPIAWDQHGNVIYFNTGETPFTISDAHGFFCECSFIDWFFDYGSDSHLQDSKKLRAILYEVEIDQRVDNLLDMIEKYNSLYPEGDEKRIDYGPVDTSKIENFEDYPYDYQCFVHKIGWLWDGYPRGNRVFSSPIALKDIPDNDPEVGDGLFDLTFFLAHSSIYYFYGDEVGVASAAKKENLSDHILVAEDNCGYSCLAFNPDTTPYTAIDIIEKQIHSSFLDYVEDHLHDLDEVNEHEKKLAAEQKESLKPTQKKGPADALRNIRRPKIATDDHKYWFEEYSKSDFTKFTIIEANISWAYWAAGKYRLLTEGKDTRIAESFIQEHKKSIEEQMGIAHESLSNWPDIPPIMKSILVQIFDNTRFSINSTLDFSGSAIFHKKLGLEKEEPTNELLDNINREQALIRTYNQFTDDLNLFSLYYKWVHAFYDLIQKAHSIKDVKTWELFAKNCRTNLKSEILTRSTIGNVAIATIMHLEIQPYSKLKLADEYARQWNNLFRSASEMNEALLELTKSGEFPNDQSFPIFEEKMDKAGISQHGASLAIAELIFNKTNLTESDKAFWRCSQMPLSIYKRYDYSFDTEVLDNAIFKYPEFKSAIEKDQYFRQLELEYAAVQFAEYTLEHTHDLYRADHRLVLESVQRKSSELQYASKELKANREIVLAAVQAAVQDVSALKYASEELRADKEIVLAAVKNNGSSLEYASEELRDDKEIVLVAAQDKWTSIIYAGVELRQDRGVISATIDSLFNMISKYNSLYPEGDERRIEYGPIDISNIRNFEDYPYDYQCFIRKIGRLSYCPGLQGLTVFSSPIALKDIPDNEPQEGDEFEGVRTFYGDKVGVASAAKTENISDHILVAEDVCASSYLTFNPNSTPYTPIDIMDSPDDTFHDSFLRYIGNSLEYPDDMLKAHEADLALESLQRKDPANSYIAMNNVRKSMKLN